MITKEVKTLITEAIKKQKWTKSSYAYAIGAMDVHSVISMWPESYKKEQVIAKFWELVETKFNRINNFTTFRHIIIEKEGFKDLGTTFEVADVLRGNVSGDYMKDLKRLNKAGFMCSAALYQQTYQEHQQP